MRFPSNVIVRRSYVSVSQIPPGILDYAGSSFSRLWYSFLDASLPSTVIVRRDGNVSQIPPGILDYANNSYFLDSGAVV